MQLPSRSELGREDAPPGSRALCACTQRRPADIIHPIEDAACCKACGPVLQAYLRQAAQEEDVAHSDISKGEELGARHKCLVISFVVPSFE